MGCEQFQPAALDSPTTRLLDEIKRSLASAEALSATDATAAGEDVKPGQLPKVEKLSGWLRDPQRFPVIIKLEGFQGGRKASGYKLRVNSQADVIVYTGDGWIMNTLGALWIRLVSVFSYVY